MNGPTSPFPGGCQVDVVGKTATSTSVYKPYNIVFDSSDNAYYAENHAVRMISKTTGIVSQIAGTIDNLGNTGDGGPGTSALLNSAVGLTLVGNLLYVVGE